MENIAFLKVLENLNNELKNKYNIDISVNHDKNLEVSFDIKTLKQKIIKDIQTFLKSYDVYLLPDIDDNIFTNKQHLMFSLSLKQ